jgi:hypothetical protein
MTAEMMAGKKVAKKVVMMVEMKEALLVEW